MDGVDAQRLASFGGLAMQVGGFEFQFRRAGGGGWRSLALERNNWLCDRRLCCAVAAGEEPWLGA